MLAVDQQLRSKKDELHDLLSSRKRKLSQIYEVTACPGLRHAPNRSNELSLKQLQTFQDVNDLSLGRLFDESTLPPRFNLTRSSREKTRSHSATKSSLEQKSASTQQAKSPSKTIKSASRNGSVQPSTRPASPLPVLRSQPKATPAEASSAASQSTTLNGSQHELSSSEETVRSQMAEQPIDHRNGSMVVPQVQRAVRKDTPQPRPIDTQQHSSPSPPAGRPLSDTPAPEAVSPTTSPGEDQIPSMEIMNNKPPESSMEQPITPVTATLPTHKLSISSVDVDVMDVDPTEAFDSPMQTKHHLVSPADSHPKSQISIDTQTEPKSYFDARQTQSIVETPGAITSRTSVKQTPATTPATDTARRATRIQSGALQKKTVSEILGETPRPASPNESTTAVSKTNDKERRDKERSRLSTVVFAKPQRPAQDTDTIELARPDPPAADMVKNEPRDYMYTLFESKAHSQSRQGSLSYLLQHSHKTLTTEDHLVDHQYQAHCRVLKRLYQLQNLDSWSLRQRKRAEEPARPTSHWDFVLDHVKWMRTDFREERRWKMAAAHAMAEACAEWVAASESERKALQVRLRPKRVQEDIMDHDGESRPVSPPPELVPHDEDDMISEDLADPRDVLETVAPAEIFSLSSNDFTFATAKTPAFDKVINELPLYQPIQIQPDPAKSNLAEKLDSRWKTDIVPVSRYATEKLKVKEYKPPRKRSRYDYDVDESPSAKRPALEPQESGVALFMPENKHIRDRIHPGHAFRPPAEHPMPSQAFFETRQSSQWLASEDDEIRRLAREYSFNWTLISEFMTPPSLYTTGQDRRTPWECFERWIGLEGMPADMAKTPYFRTYSNRIENAQRNVQAQWEEHERRNGPTPGSNRRKTTLPVRVERKHNRRHLFTLDAMRKLAKRREAIRHKAAQSAESAAMRKSNDAHAPRPQIKTPAEWSQLKFDREQKMAKQQEMYKQQLIAHQRAVNQQQQRGGTGVANGVPVPPQAPGQMRIMGPNGIAGPGMPNGLPQGVNGQPRPHPNMMNVPQAVGMPAGMGPQGMPHNMAGMGRGMAGSPQQIKMQQAQLLRQTQGDVTHSSPNVPHAALANGQGLNASMPFMNGVPGQGSQNATNGASPRPPSSHNIQNMPNVPTPKINQLYAALKERNPNMTDEEVRKIATSQLLQWQQQQTAAVAAATPVNRPKVNQAAINAAIGAANSGAYAAAQNQNAMNANSSISTGNSGGVMSYEQAAAYHANMRLQQAQQNAARGMQGQGMMNSPVMSMARPVSQHSHSSMNRGSVPPGRDQRSASAAANSTPNMTPSAPQTQAQQQSAQAQPGQGSPRPTSQAPVQT